MGGVKAGASKIFSSLAAFLARRKNRRLLYLAALCIFAFADYLYMGLARKTFTFYTISTGSTVVESRLLKKSGVRETEIKRYVDEALLGPASRDLELLFSRGTRLRSLLYRDGVVYADLTEQAAMHPADGGDIFTSLLTLNLGIRRNFSFVKNVRIFIGGNEVFFNEFRVFFENSADNRKT